MGAPPIHHEPTVNEILLQDQDCEPLFRNSGWLEYFLKSTEFNEKIVREFTHIFSDGEAQVKGLRVVVIEEQIAEREKGKDKQIDTKQKEERSKSRDVTPLVPKKQKVTKTVSPTTTKVVEELTIGSSPAPTQEKSHQKSGRLQRNPRGQGQIEETNVTILIDSTEHGPHSPHQSNVPSSPPKELRRKEEKDKELEKDEEAKKDEEEEKEAEKYEEEEKEEEKDVEGEF
ncbi:uncharacterized protein LOC131075186 [Cryptomeria japonica]|uniref:uncharacterized protein LOC131075186 n=1 Tax=Cryptomeria japonica TaxID=3369 RepID=UPI0027DA63EC|nr:uncharacterized protein LOC131075186 [Cryptomeria japonica]